VVFVVFGGAVYLFLTTPVIVGYGVVGLVSSFYSSETKNQLSFT